MFETGLLWARCEAKVSRLTQERPQFDWDEMNIRHLARHGLSPEEAEQVLLNWQIDLDTYIRN
jgi:hypothetical protein